MMRNVLVLVFTLCLLLVSSMEVSADFKDVPKSFHGYDEINYIVDNGYMSGETSSDFGRSNPITRGQAAAVLTKVLQYDTSEISNPNFKDVSIKHGFYKQIAATTEAGLFKKTTNFNPSKSLTRAQTASILARALQITSPERVDFVDVTINHGAYEEIAGLAYNGITTGYQDLTFKPNNTISRAEFAIFLARALNKDFVKGSLIVPQAYTDGVYTPWIIDTHNGNMTSKMREISYDNFGQIVNNLDFFDEIYGENTSHRLTYKIHRKDQNRFSFSIIHYMKNGTLEYELFDSYTIDGGGKIFSYIDEYLNVNYEKFEPMLKKAARIELSKPVYDLQKDTIDILISQEFGKFHFTDDSVVLEFVTNPSGFPLKGETIMVKIPYNKFTGLMLEPNYNFF